MMGLQSMDKDNAKLMKLLPPTEDLIELEERRRTFWAAYFGDRWISAGTGWPMSINESDIFTKLPTSEFAFKNGTDETGPFLPDVLAGDSASQLKSPFGGLILAATLFGRNFSHIHENTGDENAQDIQNGTFWHRYRELDNILSGSFIHLPDDLKISAGLEDEDLRIIFLHMGLHTSVICLHKAAAITAMKYILDPNLVFSSISRSIVAAEEITSMMKMISHHDIAEMNPWTGFALYTAGRAFCLDIRSDGPTRVKSQANLEYLILAMRAIGRRHHVIRPFTLQLDSEFQSIKSTTSYQNTRPVRELSPDSNATTRNTYHLAESSLLDEITHRELKELAIPKNQLATKELVTQPPLSGILLEEYLHEKKTSLQESVDHNNDICISKEMAPSYTTPYVESLQSNITSKSNSNGPIAYSKSLSPSHQNTANFTLRSSKETESEGVHGHKNSDKYERETRNIAGNSNGGNIILMPLDLGDEHKESEINNFLGVTDAMVTTQYLQHNYGIPLVARRDEQINFEQDNPNNLYLYPYSFKDNGTWY
ncbi:fungal specific transcription factor [Phlyctema vagabunda]|uniref:Fungal specific transcription factor n=1 Tax=Phlyctema vagabunda TaxID=108571 RepID=A0ABR4PDJ1_9HELO